MPKKLANKIIITSHTKYEVSQSEPSHQKFVWSYEITIVNGSDEVIQLLSRYWRITDMTGKIDEIRGAGVIGLQPMIRPGRKFTYTSYCQLLAPQGTMEGYYEMQTVEEKVFKVEVPKFILSAPSSITKLYRNRLH